MTRLPSRLTCLTLLALAALAGCQARPVPGSPAGVVTVPTGDATGGGGGPTATFVVSNCTPCHGSAGFSNAGADPLVAAAPPKDSLGATTGAVVGAHRAHLVDGPIARAVECASCHLLPAEFPHGAQRQGKVSFSRVATATFGTTRAAPTWNGTSCAGTYCHGNFKNGANATVAWNDGPVTCGSCHGVSTNDGPGGTHPGGVGTNCGSCHGGIFTSTVADPALHVNGVLDLDIAAFTCSGCHGDNTRTPVASAGALDVDSSPLVQAAPPRDTSGSTVSAAVGAHLAHVNQGDARAPGALSLAVACVTCHPVPTSKGHANDAVDVAFGGLAVAGGATPGAYNFTTHTCASTYCHGAFPGGLGANALAWTGSTKLGCTSCHLSPPPVSASSHHPQNPSCATCHAGYTATTVSAATHVDGTVQHQPATGCTQCHGDLTASGVARTDVRAAPAGNANAVDTHGNPAATTSARGVGAHAAHLTGTTWRATPIACAECHVVPAAGDVTHASSANATLTFGTLSTTAWTGGPVAPAWNGSTCSGTYCHGNFRNGANASPTWASPSAVGCGSCHGVSTDDGPGGTHPAGVGTNCASCHGGTYTNAAVDAALHLNGTLDLQNMSCSSCHGDAARTPVASAGTPDVDGFPLVRASPPRDASGVTVSPAVGAHLAHVNRGDAAAPGPLSNAIACATCHLVPTAKVHASSSVDVAFAGLAVAAGATPSAYDLGGHSCSGTYCHGNFQGGRGANPIAWTAAGKLDCNSCHVGPPPTVGSHHPANENCGACHSGYTLSTVAAATHVDGLVQHTPATGCTQCHGDLSVNGVARTDVRAAPAGNAAAVDAHGNPATATGAAGVGAHAKHLTGTTFRATPIACADCHVVPAAGDVLHANATIDVPFGTLARSVISGAAPNPQYSRPGNSCSSTYCHGAFTNGANLTVTWASATPTAVACGSCHAVSATNGPGGTHPDVTGQACSDCHGAGYSTSAVNLTLHLNGRLDGGGEPDAGGTSCGGCHGTITNAMTGGVAKFSKHLLGGDVPTDSGVAWVTTLSNVATVSRSCVSMCHGDHPHDLTSPATATHEANVYVDASTSASRDAAAASRVGPGGSGTQNRDRTDFRAGAANGGLCMSCHRQPVDAARPALDAAGYDASAHDFTFNTVSGARVTWQYGLHQGSFERNCTKCHASAQEGNTPSITAGSANAGVHYGDNAFLLAGKKNPAGSAAGFVCYNCHGSTASPGTGVQGDRSGKDIQAQIAKPYRHPAHADAVHDSAAELSAAAFGNALGVAAGPNQRHASCMDCHDSHEARAGTHTAQTNLAGPPLQGAWGVAFGGTLAAGAAPTAANFTKKVIVAGQDLEATLCFKCHSAFYMDPSALPTAPGSLARAPAYRETDQAREFNPNNMSYHPVLAAVRADRATPDIKAPWTTTSTMTCSDCHESESTTDPNGPHGSATPFLLKGPNTLWDPSLAISSVTGGVAMPDGTFCINCHNQRFTSSRAGQAHTLTRHRGTQNGAPVRCMSCHIRIPHGSGHRGLLVSTDATKVDGGAVFTDSAPYAVSPRLVIESYPTGTTTWQQENCSCDTSGSH